MYINFVQPAEDAASNKLADVELIFEKGEPLAGLKLVGFSLWKNASGVLFVTMPSRAFGVGAKRTYYDFLRSARERRRDTQDLRDAIIKRWKEQHLEK